MPGLLTVIARSVHDQIIKTAECVWEEEKHCLMPERLVMLIADKPRIEAVSKHSQDRQAFLETAIDFCRSEKARAQKPSHKVQNRKRTLREITGKPAKAGFVPSTDKLYGSATVSRMIET
jgi:hypothetical protein